MGFSRAFLIMLALCAFVSSARAENWVTPGDPWWWIDLDSISRQGAITSYVLEHSRQAGSPPNVGGGYGPDRKGVDCGTAQVFEMAGDGSWAPSMSEDVIDWDKDWDDPANKRTVPYYMDKTGRTYTLVCGR